MLEKPLTELFRISENQQKALKRLGIITARDILYYFPVRYGDVAKAKYIEDLVPEEHAAVFGTVKKIGVKKSFRGGVPMAEATIEDETGVLKAVWFHQAFIAKTYREGSLVKLDGKVSEKNGTRSMANPEIEHVSKIPLGIGSSLFGEDDNSYAYPVYRESRGVSSKWIFHTIEKLLNKGLLENTIDPIPEKILKQYSLPTLQTALVWIHSPKKKDHAESARKRFAFEEMFFIQIHNNQERSRYRKKDSFVIDKKTDEIAKFIDRLPFSLTEAQEKATSDIISDFKKDFAMSRLLEGDVGSGKTAVAAITSYAVVTTHPKNQDFGNLQVAIMAPTEILAEQHFETFIEMFRHLPIQIGLITGSGCKKFPSKVSPTEPTNISRAQLLKWVANGEIPILIGTHSLIQKKVTFENLAYIIIDEQHRFGTKQRFNLRKKDDVLPHLLSMTATPIPRTLALTIYGDLDLTLLDQMPSGRKPVITEIVPPHERKETYEKIRTELEAGRQCYVICPRIDEPDPDKEKALLAKSVKAECARLKKEVFPDYNIDMLHGKMTPKAKAETMEELNSGEIDILVATSVVEVGVNVPNATVIIIEGAERYGLAQLHQLRGRVIRGTHQPYCYIFSDTENAKSLNRLSSLVKAKNGFELAEFDLENRGAGDLAGRKQWGVSDLAMEALRNMRLVEAARKEARELVDKDPELSKHPKIKAVVDAQERGVHAE